jgi:hypothetical protein
MLTYETPAPIPPAAESRSGIDCSRAGGDGAYCGCLDRLDAARSEAGLPAPSLPAFDDPVVLYAMRHHERFPVINGDTPRCLRLGTRAAPGSPA